MKTVVNFQRSLDQRAPTLIRGGVGNLLALFTIFLVQRSDKNRGAPRGGRRKRWMGYDYRDYGAISNRERKMCCYFHAESASPRT